MEAGIQLTQESQKLINNLARAGKLDLRPIMKVIGIGYRKEVAQIFDKKQARGQGLRWKPLSDNPPGKGYASRKAKEWPGQPLLVRSGSLLASMIAEGAPGNITIIGKTFATFGSSVPYGVYHDSDKEPRKKLPRRNFSEPSERREAIWLDQLNTDIRKQFENNGIKITGSIFK